MSDKIDKTKIKENINDISKKSSGFINEFKKFISRGNVMDLAVGVIVGAAFTNIVTSLSNNILMPIVGLVIGGLNFKSLSANFEVWGKEVTIEYGLFIQSAVDFLITAFCIFIIIKLLNKFFTKKEETKPTPTKTEEVKLLEEIRDLLKDAK